MFVVPLRGDKIQTKDDDTPKVVTSYTCLKEEPAVYLDKQTSQEPFVFFSDISVINGVKVDYNPDSRLFEALGPLRRKYNLPQPKDVIKVKLIEADFKDETADVTVTKLKLHGSKSDAAHGLQVCGSKSCFPLDQILGIDRTGWTETFKAEGFKRYYLDYFPLTKTVK